MFEFQDLHSDLRWISKVEEQFLQLTLFDYSIIEAIYYGIRYENKLKSGFDQWPNLHLDLNVEIEIQILKLIELVIGITKCWPLSIGTKESKNE